MRRQHHGDDVTGDGARRTAVQSAAEARSPLELPRRPGPAERKLRSATAAGLVAAIALGGGVVAPVTRAVLHGGAARALADTVPDVDGLSSWLGVSDGEADAAPNWLGPSPLRLHSPSPAATAGGRAVDAGQVLAALTRAREVDRARQAAEEARRAAEAAAARQAAAEAAAAQAAAEQAAAERAAAERAEAERLAAEQQAAAEAAEAERVAAEEAAEAERAAAAAAAWQAAIDEERREAEQARFAPSPAVPAATPTAAPGGAAPEALRGQPAPSAAAAAPALATATQAAPVAAMTAAEAQFVGLLNAQRAAVGLGPVVPEAGLAASARAQAQRIANAGALSHQDLSPLLGAWTSAGENVGFGPDVSSISNALVNSPGHYANIVGARFTHVGVAVVTSPDGRLWVAQLFGG